MTRRIFAQGDFDGACYLYSIANSYVALTSRQLTAKQWKKSICASPFKLDDFLTSDGTKSLDDNLDYLEGLCRDFLNGIRKTQFQVTRKKVSETSLRASLTDKQVAIVAIDGGDHWVSVVDADAEQLYIACSAMALSDKTKTPLEERVEEGEGVSPNFQRAFNKKSSFANLKVLANYSLFVIHVTDA